MSRWCESVGPGISSSAWMSPAATSCRARTSRKKICRRLRCARALKASTCASVACSRAMGSVFIFRKVSKYRTRVKPSFSDLDHHAVVGAFLGHGGRVGQHLAAHVREDHPLGAEVLEVLDEDGIVEVPLDGLFVVVALGDDEVGVLAHL